MKLFLGGLTLVLFSLTAANASLVSCASATGAVTLGESAALTFTCGGLTFGNFEVASENGDAVGTVYIDGATFDSVTGTVNLNIDPNLGSAQDEAFMYEVWGGVTQLDLSVGGTDATVTERACSSAIETTGPMAFLCPDGTILGTVSDMSNDPNAPVFSRSFATSSPIYVFKDIETGSGAPFSVVGSGQLSEMNQSFEVGAATPEPVSLLLLGSGLLALGLLRRRASNH